MKCRSTSSWRCSRICCSDAALDTVLVFTRTKHGADRIARKLESSGITTGTLHSNRSQNQRLRALKDFKAGAVRVLVATDIAARGIDVDGISHVVNYDFPMHAGGLRPPHRPHRPRAGGRRRDQLCHAGRSRRAASLERFIGRGIVRKRAEGFDSSAAAAPGEPRIHDDRVSHRRPAPLAAGSSRTGRACWRPAPWRRSGGGVVAVVAAAVEADARRPALPASAGADSALRR